MRILNSLLQVTATVFYTTLVVMILGSGGGPESRELIARLKIFLLVDLRFEVSPGSNVTYCMDTVEILLHRTYSLRGPQERFPYFERRPPVYYLFS